MVRLPALTQADVRSTFDYVPETGRLVRVRRGLGARVGVTVGSTDPNNGHRRAYFKGGNRMTTHLVWLWHNGSMPNGILRHINDINSDDRIENLVILKKQLPVSYAYRGEIVNQYGRLPPEIQTGIYEIFCTANGRRYVGSAVNLEHRWRLHYTQLCGQKHHSPHLQHAWGKHGEGAFVFRVLERCDRAALIEREQHYIDTLKPEFNSRPDAGSQLGWSPNEETRKRMSAARAGKSSAMRGRKHSEEAKARMSANRIGKGGGPRSPERLAKISAAMKGRIITSEHRAKIAATLTGTSTGRGKLSDEQVRAIRAKAEEGLRQIEISNALGIPSKWVHTVVRKHGYTWVS